MRRFSQGDKQKLSDHMARISIVYQTGKGHTGVIAENIASGVRAVEGCTVELIQIRPANVVEGRWSHEPTISALEQSHGIVFGAATYMGSVSAVFKAFLEKAFDPWLQQLWKDKVAGGFTNSASQNGDKLSTLFQLSVFAAQMGMLWVGVGDLPSNNWSGGTVDDINRLGAWLGVMGQSNADQGLELAPSQGDRKTAKRYGRRFAMVTQRWIGQATFETERFSEEDWRAKQVRSRSANLGIQQR